MMNGEAALAVLVLVSIIIILIYLTEWYRERLRATNKGAASAQELISIPNFRSSTKPNVESTASIKYPLPSVSSFGKQEFVVHEDISNGREFYKVPAISFRAGDKAPLDFHYVTDHVQYDSINVDQSLKTTSSCSCTNDCADRKCYCSSGHNLGFCYDKSGLLAPHYNINCPTVIYECNAGCQCNRRTCTNMVIQRGSRCQLALIRTNERGWGVRCLERLERGTFVGIYSGELILAESSASRPDDTYLFNLTNAPMQSSDEFENTNQTDEETGASGEKLVRKHESTECAQYVCDAKYYGNLTRFINHSCEPNLVGIRSFTSHHDSRFPHIAFFTNQVVPAKTELTLNYGDNYWLVKCKRDNIFCLCNQSNCRFSKQTFPKTYKQYRKQQSLNSGHH